jgi:hypothetical protein
MCTCACARFSNLDDTIWPLPVSCLSLPTPASLAVEFAASASRLLASLTDKGVAWRPLRAAGSGEDVLARPPCAAPDGPPPT